MQGGVAPGNFVVVDGADKLREGSKVELIDRNAQAQQPADTRRAPQGEGKGVGERGGRRFKGGG